MINYTKAYSIMNNQMYWNMLFIKHTRGCYYYTRGQAGSPVRSCLPQFSAYHFLLSFLRNLPCYVFCVPSALSVWTQMLGCVPIDLAGLVAWLIHWLIGLVVRLTDLGRGWSDKWTGWLVDWLAGLLTGCLVGRSASNWVGWLTSWLVG